MVTADLEIKITSTIKINTAGRAIFGSLSIENLLN
jgi:hypothetical protein